MRDGLTAAFFAAMLVVTLAPRHRPPPPAAREDGWSLQVAWLAQRESAVGDWEAVHPPLREGDELQLTVLASDDVCVYVLDGQGHRLFPAPEAAASIQGRWPYAMPGPHRTWRLDGADHDDFFVVAARHPIANPASYTTPTASTAVADLILPLRDGRRGGAVTRRLQSDGVIVDHFSAR
jgi:hypothetical protein